LAKYGTGDGCETCKPVTAGILASLVNGMILDDGRDALQDTNDRSLANMQRGGTYCKYLPRNATKELFLKFESHIFKLF
jgi:NAD(P)H-nitrite reductase large subunit